MKMKVCLCEDPVHLIVNTIHSFSGSTGYQGPPRQVRHSTPSMNPPPPYSSPHYYLSTAPPTSITHSVSNPTPPSSHFSPYMLNPPAQAVPVASPGRGTRGRGVRSRGSRARGASRGGGGIRLVDTSLLLDRLRAPANPTFPASDSFSAAKPGMSSTSRVPQATHYNAGYQYPRENYDLGSLVGDAEVDTSLDNIRIENVLGGIYDTMGGESANRGYYRNNYCANCKSLSEMQCSGCNRIFYCSNECQLDHWNAVHHRECVPLPS